MSDELQTEEDNKKMLNAVLAAEEAAEDKRSGTSSLDDLLKQHEDVASKWDGGKNPFEEAKSAAEQKLASRDVSPDTTKAPEVAEGSPAEEASGADEPDPPTPAPEQPLSPPPLEQAPAEPWANLAHRLKQTQDASPSVDPLLEKMRAVGWAPPEKKPVDWAQLQANLQAAERSADTTKNVGAMLHAAAPGFEAPHDAGAGEVAAAKAALEAPKEQQAMEHAQAQAEHDKLQQAAAAKTAAKTAELDDPKSEASARARDALKAQFGDTGKLPPDFERYTANEVAKLAPTLGTIAGHQSTEHVAKQREEAQANEKRAEEAAKEAARVKAVQEKEAATKAAHEADVESLGAAKALWIKTSPFAHEHGITAADLADIKSRKDWEDFLHTTLPKGKPAAPKGPAPKPVTSVDQIEDPGLRALVHSALSGYPIAEGIDRKTKTRVLELATQINPNFDPTRGKQYEKVVEKQAASDDKMAIDVALEHLGTAEKAIPENADAKFVNEAKQAMAAGSGSAEFKPYITASSVAAHELARVYGIGDQAGKEMVEHMLASVQSPAQLKATFVTLKELVSGKRKGFEEQLSRVAPQDWAKLHGNTPPPSPLGEPAKGPPPKGSVTVFDTKTRRSVSKTPEEADTIVKKGGGRFTVVGGPTQ